EGGRGQQRVDDAEADRLARWIQRSTEEQLRRTRVREPEADDLEGDPRIGGADRDLVEADPVVAVEPEAVVAGEHENETSGDRVPVRHREGRLRERQQRDVGVAVERAPPPGRRLVAARGGGGQPPAGGASGAG